jgi:hypothetical protein
MPPYKVEYKFIFTAAVWGAPLAALALEAWLARAGRAWLAWIAGGALVLALPFVVRIRRTWPDPSLAPPAVERSGFELCLEPRAPNAELYQALRERTPPDTVLVARSHELFLPALTDRAYFAPPAEERPLPGVTIRMHQLIGPARGYDPRLVERRIAVREALFGGDDAARARAFEELAALGRPLAFVLQQDSHQALRVWLERSTRGELLAESAELAVWYVEPPPR